MSFVLVWLTFAPLFRGFRLLSYHHHCNCINNECSFIFVLSFLGELFSLKAMNSVRLCCFNLDARAAELIIGATFGR